MKKNKFGDLVLKDSMLVVPFDVKHKGNVLAIHILNGHFIFPETQKCNAKGLVRQQLERRKDLKIRHISCTDTAALFYICYNLIKTNKLLKQLGYPVLKKDNYWTDLRGYEEDHDGYILSMKNGGLHYIEKYISSNNPCEEDYGYTNEEAIALLGFHINGL